MQKYSRSIAMLMAIVFFCTGHAQTRETDVFLKKVFTVLKTQDEKAFVQLYPDKEKFKKILLSMMKAQSGDDTASIARGMAMIGEITDSTLYRDFSAQYKSTMEKSRAKNLDWSNAVMSSYVADTLNSDEITGKQLKGKIFFKSGPKDYFLVFNEVIWPRDEAGWYGISIRKIGEVGKDSEDEISADQSMDASDSATVMMDSVAVATVDTVVLGSRPAKDLKAAPKNNKTKSPANKIKPKPKTAALKPKEK